MCDAVYINKEQLKVIKLEELLKKWDKKHFQKTFGFVVWLWKSSCREDNGQKYYEEILKKLYFVQSRQQIKNNFKRFYINELNKVKAIKGNGEGYWYCYIDENIGIFNNNYPCIGQSECRTFTEFKNQIKQEIHNRVDKFMTKPDKEIAEHMENMYGEYIYSCYNIVYKIRKESTNRDFLLDSVRFNPNRFPNMF